MKATHKIEIPREKRNRRSFLLKSFRVAVLTGIGSIIIPGCKEAEPAEKKVSPPEDLMQEHGLLNRVLLIYDHCKTQLMKKQAVDYMLLFSSADIIRTFVEDYHEKQEENYLFPRFRKANQLTGLVDTLLLQHQAGRNITDEIIQITKNSKSIEGDSSRLTELLTAFVTMYRPHEAREDTVLFPAFRKLVSQHEYDSLGEEFEQNEHKHFGGDGFEIMVNKVAGIEKQLGIYNLAQFTPSA